MRHGIDGTGKFLVPGLADSNINGDDVPTLETLNSFRVTTTVNMACNDHDICSALMNVSGRTSHVTSTYAVSPSARLTPAEALRAGVSLPVQPQILGKQGVMASGVEG